MHCAAERVSARLQPQLGRARGAESAARNQDIRLRELERHRAAHEDEERERVPAALPGDVPALRARTAPGGGRRRAEQTRAEAAVLDEAAGLVALRVERADHAPEGERGAHNAR